MRNTSICGLAILAFVLHPFMAAQTEDPVSAEPKSGNVQRTIDNLFNYLNMAGAEKASNFKPLTQR